MFWQNKAITKEELRKIDHEFGLMSVRQVRMEAEIDQLQQGLKVLRGFVNKKLKLEYDEAEEEPEIPIKEVHEDGFDELRQLRSIHGS